MKYKVWILTTLLLAGCQLFRLQGPPATATPVKLPPEWTDTPAPIAPIEASAESTNPTPQSNVATETPLPAGYEQSTWLIQLEGPVGWSRANSMVELSDGTILMMGPIYQSRQLHSAWLGRLDRTGQVLWLKSLEIPAAATFFAGDMASLPTGVAVVSGNYHQPDGRGGVERRSFSFGVTYDGRLAWTAPFGDEIVENQLAETLLVIDTRQAREIDSDGEATWKARLTFGEDETSLDPGSFFPDILQAYRSVEGDFIVGGSIEENVVPGDSVAQAGPNPGYTSYWFARFDPEGGLVWKHFFSVDPLAQWDLLAARMESGNLIIGGTARQLVTNDRGSYSRSLYGWLHALDPAGQTAFHQRFLDLPKLEGIAATPDGGLILYGRRFIEQGDDPFASQQVILVKVGPDWRIEWARQFQQDLELNRLLPLSDGSYLLSLGTGITLARLNPEGWIGDCAELVLEPAQMQLAEQPARFDRAAAVPLALVQQREETLEQLPALAINPSPFSSVERCRELAEVGD